MEDLCLIFSRLCVSLYFFFFFFPFLSWNKPGSATNAKNRVLIITALRIAALKRVTSQDFSYDRGYLGLLSILGPLITIVCCCATSIPRIASCCGLERKKSWSFSSTKVLWSIISTHRSRWWSSTATRNDQKTEAAAVVSKLARLESASASDLPLDTRRAIATLPILTRVQPAAQTPPVTTQALSTAGVSGLQLPIIYTTSSCDESNWSDEVIRSALNAVPAMADSFETPMVTHDECMISVV